MSVEAEVTKTGVLLRIIGALLLVIGVIALPEPLVNKGLVILSAVLFLGMAAALIFPWRKPDLLGWEFFGLFLALGVIFSVGVAQTFGWLPIVLPFTYRVSVRAFLVIFEAGVLTGLIRVGRLRWRVSSKDDRSDAETRQAVDGVSDHRHAPQ